MLNISLILCSIDEKRIMSILIVIVVFHLNMPSDISEIENLKSIQFTVHFTKVQLQ